METRMRREYSTTEFIALIGMVIVWLFDRRYGTDLFDQIDLATVDGVKAEVLALAADLRGQAGQNSNLLVIIGLAIYALRKIEKILARMGIVRGELRDE